MSNSIVLLHTRSIAAVCVLLFSLATYGQQNPSSQPQSGKDLKVDGTIAARSAETLTLVTLAGERIGVVLAPATRIVESDIGKSYSDKAIFPGLYVSISGRSNSTGQLVAM
jgi:hypothetical protein